ncbi:MULTISPECIES: hypothetical protein [Bradyrhizobium]|uniref:hypothetical protein n=1 Tax=Bradyrhizobium TaxID=374 RepID=UPI001913696A|nr:MULTISPECIES: hypothetical protein [Bradyrhizobium]WOH56784.1 hypothetical protein RX329_31695 [Bradyrhizobium sp. BWC-3-1]
MPAADAAAPHAKRQLGTLALSTGIAVGLIQRAHVGIAGRAHPRHQAERFYLIVAGDLCFEDAAIAKCLDHAVTKKGDTTVADRHGQGLQPLQAHEGEARNVEGLAAELRRIVGAPVANALEHRRARLLARLSNSEHIIAFAAQAFPCA